MTVRQIVVVLLALVCSAPNGFAQESTTGTETTVRTPVPGQTLQDAQPPSKPSLERMPTPMTPLGEAAVLHPNEAKAQYQRATELLNYPVSPPNPTTLPPGPAGTIPEAIQALRMAVQLSPEWVEPRLLLGETLLRVGDLDGALNEYRRILQGTPTEPRAYLGLAKGLMARQEWPGAQAALKEAVREDPTLVEAHYLLGAVQYSQGRLRAAMEAYRKTLWLKPAFPDAHHQLGLLLKLGHRDKEAVEEFRQAATGGVAEAQYFLGQAYRTGKGITPDPVQAIHWWIRATELGHAAAWSALRQLRRQARSAAAKTSGALFQAFTEYRASLWQGVPDLTPGGEEDSPGLALLNQGRGAEAVPMLIREAWGLSEAAHARLESLYEQGDSGGVAPFNPRILAFLEQCATEDVLTSKVTLARIYFHGLGVPKDHDKVKSLLRGLSKAERLRLWGQFSSEGPAQ